MLQEQWTTNWGSLGPSSGWNCVRKQPKLLMLRCWSLTSLALASIPSLSCNTHTDTHTHRHTHAHTPTHPNLQKLHLLLPIRGVFPQLGEHISAPCIKQGWRWGGSNQVSVRQQGECISAALHQNWQGGGWGEGGGSNQGSVWQQWEYFCGPASKLTRGGGGGGGVKSGEGLATGWVYFCCSASKWWGQQFKKKKKTKTSCSQMFS